MTAAFVSQFMPYGAPELQRAARPHMVRALMLSSLLVTTAFALAWSLSLFYHPSAVIEVPIARPHDTEAIEILKPPPIQPPVAPIQHPVSTRAVDAVPIPKPDAAVPEDQTIKGQPDYGRDVASTPTQGGGIAVSEGAGDKPVNELGEVPFVDQYPQAIVRVKPVYPEIAMQAQVEGTVMVHILIGKDGRVREAKLHPEKHVPMLDAAALEAARRWTFEPALVNGHPVAVWALVPFKFALR